MNIKLGIHRIASMSKMLAELTNTVAENVDRIPEKQTKAEDRKCLELLALKLIFKEAMEIARIAKELTPPPKETEL